MRRGWSYNFTAGISTVKTCAIYRAKQILNYSPPRRTRFEFMSTISLFCVALRFPPPHSHTMRTFFEIPVGVRRRSKEHDMSHSFCLLSKFPENNCCRPYALAASCEYPLIQWASLIGPFKRPILHNRQFYTLNLTALQQKQIPTI